MLSILREGMICKSIPISISPIIEYNSFGGKVGAFLVIGICSKLVGCDCKQVVQVDIVVTSAFICPDDMMTVYSNALLAITIISDRYCLASCEIV